jgi:Uma2 family endonuclease
LIAAALEPPCQGFGSDTKVRIRSKARDVFYYPDLSVSCVDEGENPYYNERPVLIVEVVSPSTERTDKHEKLFAYRNLASLEEYVLVHQEIRQVWVYRRSSGWEKEVVNEGEVWLASVGVSLSLDAVYRDVPA